MRYAAVTPSARTLLGIVVVLACGALSPTIVVGEGDAGLAGTATKHDGAVGEQLDVAKRTTWAAGNPSMMHSWGKRTWQNLQGGWGKRDPWTAANSYPLYGSDKRAWQNLQGGWGKRFADEEDDAAKLAELLADDEQDADLDKRGWRSLNNAGWGKRSAQWNNFRGSWGKRDPQWTNLKGIWGKRSVQDEDAE